MLKDMEVCPRCNRAEFAHKRRSSVCSWCCAHLTKRSLDKYHYEPFLWYRRHSPEAVRLHVKAISQWPHLSTARWEPEQRQLILRYLAWSDDSRCGLCAMPLPVGQAQVEHIVPKMFGYFDLNGIRVKHGTTYQSRLHHVDNLQAAHE